jgi:hypothetical protein
MQSLTAREDKKMDNLRMIEKSIKESENYTTEPQLWSRLRSKISKRITLRKLLRQLEADNKIIRDKDGSIVWIFVDSPQARKSLEESVPLH